MLQANKRKASQFSPLSSPKRIQEASHDVTFLSFRDLEVSAFSPFAKIDLRYAALTSRILHDRYLVLAFDRYIGIWDIKTRFSLLVGARDFAALPDFVSLDTLATVEICFLQGSRTVNGFFSISGEMNDQILYFWTVFSSNEDPSRTFRLDGLARDEFITCCSFNPSHAHQFFCTTSFGSLFVFDDSQLDPQNTKNETIILRRQVTTAPQQILSHQFLKSLIFERTTIDYNIKGFFYLSKIQTNDIIAYSSNCVFLMRPGSDPKLFSTSKLFQRRPKLQKSFILGVSASSGCVYIASKIDSFGDLYISCFTIDSACLELSLFASCPCPLTMNDTHLQIISRSDGPNKQCLYSIPKSAQVFKCDFSAPSVSQMISSIRIPGESIGCGGQKELFAVFATIGAFDAEKENFDERIDSSALQECIQELSVARDLNKKLFGVFTIWVQNRSDVARLLDEHSEDDLQHAIVKVALKIVNAVPYRRGKEQGNSLYSKRNQFGNYLIFFRERQVPLHPLEETWTKLLSIGEMLAASIAFVEGFWKIVSDLSSDSQRILQKALEQSQNNLTVNEDIPLIENVCSQVTLLWDMLLEFHPFRGHPDAAYLFSQVIIDSAVAFFDYESTFAYAINTSVSIDYESFRPSLLDAIVAHSSSLFDHLIYTQEPRFFYQIISFCEIAYKTDRTVGDEMMMTLLNHWKDLSGILPEVVDRDLLHLLRGQSSDVLLFNFLVALYQTNKDPELSQLAAFIDEKGNEFAMRCIDWALENKLYQLILRNPLVEYIDEFREKHETKHEWWIAILHSKRYDVASKALDVVLQDQTSDKHTQQLTSIAFLVKAVENAKLNAFDPEVPLKDQSCEYFSDSKVETQIILNKIHQDLGLTTKLSPASLFRHILEDQDVKCFDIDSSLIRLKQALILLTLRPDFGTQEATEAFSDWMDDLLLVWGRAFKWELGKWKILGTQVAKRPLQVTKREDVEKTLLFNVLQRSSLLLLEANGNSTAKTDDLMGSLFQLFLNSEHETDAKMEWVLRRVLRIVIEELK